jgi:hypothetical protein
MADKKKQKHSVFKDMLGMMKMAKKSMSGKESACDCSALMEGFKSDAVGFDCSAMMKAMFGQEGVKSEETAAKV